MILYLDTSALTKKYIEEAYSADVVALLEQSDLVGASLLARVELPAAVAKAVRMHWLSAADGERALKAFRAEWPSLLAVQVTESLVIRADNLAWEHGLRAYDAVHLSAALIWQEALGEPVTVATFDKQLWQAANAVGLATWPPSLE
ncbi:MAG: type II toxin-antitoxin system VapC family toxin [Anaerolineales bacterium]|nr:type II toxin-antitoxin system VapC family toxin [Anaerolineales bacterium]